MDKDLKILFIEDDPRDAEVAVNELKKAGIACVMRRVETDVELTRELEAFAPDIVLGDFTLPAFDGLSAFHVVRERCPDTPFIFVSGTIGEEKAIETLKRGATDYVLKTNLKRLAPAVRRALKEVDEYAARKRAEEKRAELSARLQKHQEQLTGILATVPGVVWEQYGQPNIAIHSVNFVSEYITTLTGYSMEDWLTTPDFWLVIMHPDDREEAARTAVENFKNGKTGIQQFRWITKDSRTLWVESTYSMIHDERHAPVGLRGVTIDITQRKRTEEALRESETHLRTIIETEPECVKIVSGNGKLLDMNQAGLAMLQAGSLAEAQQQSLLEFIAPEHRAAFGDLHRRVMNGESGSLEFEVIGLKGTRRWLETSAAPLRNAAGEVQQLLGITRDVTERKHSEQRLRESEAKFRQLIEQAADGIFISDAEGNFVLVNSRGCELLGYTENELLGMNGKVTYLEEERKIHTKRMQEVRIGQVLRFERMVKRKDGSTFPAEVSLKMLDNGMVQVIFHDITERRNQERKFARLSRIQAVSSGINSAIVRIRDRQELFDEACRIAVTHGGFRMVWIGLVDITAKKVKPVTWAGFEDGFLSRVARLSFDEGAFEGQGVTGRAIRSKAPVVTNDFATAPHIVFKEETLQRGYHSGAVLPLLVGTEAVGVISLYAPEPGFFDAEELKLLFELAGDISFALEYMEKENKLNYLANYDALTGLPNRSLFSERLGQQLHTRADSPELVAVALMDVEHFRMVNDTLDRQAGDELLRLIALRLESNATVTRFSNPARLAADCFAVIIRGARDGVDLVRLLEAGMKACFGVPFVINGQELRIVARAGVSAYPTDGSTAESLLKNAEAALRNAKRTTERFVFYAPEMNARVAEILALETKLRKAIEFEQFVLHYQPKFDLATGKVTGVEALIRWNDPDTGLVAPARFIPILEETGMIFEVGRWALQQAVRDQQRWHAQGLPVPRVAVNVSAQQLRDGNFVRDVQLALASQEGLKPALELEITESLLMEDIERSIERLKALRDLGVTIAIDDFGTRYSSLNYLARLPMDTLKIDRSFVAGMGASPESKTIVSTIISLAHSLGLKVVAEGVETDEQLEILRLLKCDEMQGFLLSRPVPPDEIASFLILKKERAKRTQAMPGRP